jgi:hypothetical protein
MRFACRRGLVVAVSVAAVALAGCGVHLHNPGDAKQAQAALASYAKVDFDGAVATARSNSTQLARAEREALVNLTESLVAADLAAVLADAPASGDPPRGWLRVESEGLEVLGPLGILDGRSLRLAPTEDARRIANRLLRRDEQQERARIARERFDTMIRRYVRGTPPGTQKARCDYRPAPEDLAEQIPSPAEIAGRARPEGEPEAKWNFYRNIVVRACDVVRSEEAAADPATVLVKHEEFAALDARLKTLEATVRAEDVEARLLLDRLGAAKKALADAEARLAEATVQKQTAKAAADVAHLQEDVAKKAAALEAVVKESQALPFAAVLAKQELLQTILTNFRALGGADETGTSEGTRRLLALLKTYPDVAGPIRAADKPPVNLLLLELTAQRLEYQRLNAQLQADRDRLKILRGQRELMVQRATGWIRLVDAAEQLTVVDRLRAAPIAAVQAAAAQDQKARLAEVLDAYAEIRMRYDAPAAALAFDDDDRRRVLRFDLSDIALAAWKDFIRAPLQEVAAYHDGGLTSEDLANVIHAIGLGGIAVGVNR